MKNASERVGVVFGFDRKGNAKVRTLESSRKIGLEGKRGPERREAERSYRDVVLLASAGKYEAGSKILYVITSEGTNVNFSDRHVLAERTEEASRSDDTNVIDFLMFSGTPEVRYLAVGTWRQQWVDGILGKSIEHTGEICGRNYVLSGQRGAFPRAAWQYVREEVWVTDPDIRLGAVLLASKTQDRQALEELITSGLECVAKRKQQGMYPEIGR